MAINVNKNRIIWYDKWEPLFADRRKEEIKETLSHFLFYEEGYEHLWPMMRLVTWEELNEWFDSWDQSLEEQDYIYEDIVEYLIDALGNGIHLVERILKGGDE